MGKFHFLLRTGVKETPDEDGCDLPGLDAAREFALRAGRDLLAESIRWNTTPPDCIVIVDDTGRAVDTLQLADLVPESIKADIRKR